LHSAPHTHSAPPPWARPTTRRCWLFVVVAVVVEVVVVPPPHPPFSIAALDVFFFVNIHLYIYVLDPVMCATKKKWIKNIKIYWKNISIHFHPFKNIYTFYIIN
jgi:hypothetical protein